MTMFLEKSHDISNYSYGKYPGSRSIEQLLHNGILILDKWQGPTSRDVTATVKKVLSLSKAGHSGTIDPMVSGVLVVCLENACKIMPALQGLEKEYVGIMRLHKDVNKKEIMKTVSLFTGKIKQLPPVRSAVARRERMREVYGFEILEISGRNVLFRVKCEAGTYVRKLCLHPETEILSKEGIISASDFHTNPQIIYSLNKGKIVIKTPSETQRLCSPEKLIRIKMSSGIDFSVTSDHELLVSTPEGYKMIEAKNLKKSDYLVKSRAFPNIVKNYAVSDLLDCKYLIHQKDIKQACKKAFIQKYGSIRAMNKKLDLDRKAFLSKYNTAIPLEHIKLAGIYDKIKNKINTFKTEKGTVIRLDKLNAKLFYLLGLIASDGNNTKEKNTIRHTRIKFHNKNENLVDIFLYEYKNLFPNIRISKKKINNLFQLDTSNSLFATIAASLGIKSPHKDSDIIPILYAKHEFIRSFLKGYFDGDGTCYFKKKNNIVGHYTNIRFFSINFITAKRLHQMLLKLDIPNKIFNKENYFIVSLESLSAKHRFIKFVGSNHPRKIETLKKISKLNGKASCGNHYYIGLHHKNEIRKNKKKLWKMGGNLHRILNNNLPVTRNFYKKCSSIIKLPKLDNLIIEKIISVEHVKGSDYVYDMTVPETHNFLIETGYISSNCHDIGLRIGGAHMSELRRTRAGTFNENMACRIQDVADAYAEWKENGSEALRDFILPVEAGIEHLKKVIIKDSSVYSVASGSPLYSVGISRIEEGILKDEMVAVLTLKGELVSIGTAGMQSDEMLKRKGIAVKTDRVIIDKSLYKK